DFARGAERLVLDLVEREGHRQRGEDEDEIDRAHHRPPSSRMAGRPRVAASKGKGAAAVRWAARRRAERARGLAAVSASAGRAAPRVISMKDGWARSVRSGRCRDRAPVLPQRWAR